MRTLAAAAAAAALVVLLPAPASADPVNQSPVAVDDAVSYRNTGGIDHVVDALANDSHPDGGTLTYTAVTPAAKGNAYLQGGKLYYKPFLAEAGTDSFTYTVSDGQGNTATATVTATLWVDPAAPSGLTIAAPTTGAATLDWPAATDAAQYRVLRNGVLVHTTSARTWTDTGLQADMRYEYQIASVNGGGWSGPPSQAVYRLPKYGTPSLSVGVTEDPTALVLWPTSEGGAWSIYRDGALLTTTQAMYYVDTGLVTGRSYSYRIQTAGYTTATAVAPASELSPAVEGTPVVLTDIIRYIDAVGLREALGAVTVPERDVPGGRQQDHENGVVVQRDGEPAYSVTHAFATTFLAAGGTSGALGFPLTDRDCGLVWFGCGQLFESGSIWSSATVSGPARVVPQAIEDGWAATGWEEGPLHYPTTDAHCGLRGGGCWQGFQGGTVHWSPATGAHATAGLIHDAWASRGWESGRLGYPVTDEVCGLRDGACWQGFQGGTIHWWAGSGAQVTWGAIRDTWARHGWENGRLGYPTTGENCGLRNGGCWQGFQGGTIHWSPATGAQVSWGAIRDTWARYGWENGRLGYPTTSENCGLANGGCWQGFQGGTIHWSPATGAQVSWGAVRDAWARQGWENGRLGYPTTGENCGLRDGGCWQGFQGGTIHWSPATGAHPTGGRIREAWAFTGWESGGLGYPTTDENCSAPPGCIQYFQRGSVFLEPRNGTPVVSIRR